MEWIESNCFDPQTVVQVGKSWDFSNARHIKLEPYQRAILNYVLTPDEEGIFPFREIVWSQPKKSGKTATAAFVGAWFSEEVEPPNLVLCIANDKEQAAGRIFASMAPTVYSLEGDFPREGSHPFKRLSNGTIIKAIPTDAAGEAGQSYGLTLWSELWAYTSKHARLLFEELPPVATRKNSMRWIETYAGFEDESELLLSIFLRVFKDTSERELQPQAKRVTGLVDPQTGEVFDDLPCYVREDMGMFMFWDHEHRMPWQRGPRGEKYYAQEQVKERASSYIRLHENRWQKSEGTYLHSDWINRSFKPALGELLEPMVFAADGSTGRKQGAADNTALVGVKPCAEYVNQKLQVRYRTGHASIWEIPLGKEIDLDETLIEKLKELARKGLIIYPVWFDPVQLHQPMLNFAKWCVAEGLVDNIEKATAKFNQGVDRLLADTLLFKLYRDDQIDNYEAPLFRQNLEAARAMEDKEQRLRIIKQTVTKGAPLHTFKIDGAVAQSMAVYRASLLPPPPPPPRVMISSRTADQILGLD